MALIAEALLGNLPAEMSIAGPEVTLAVEQCCGRHSQCHSSAVLHVLPYLADDLAAADSVAGRQVEP